MSSLFPFYLCAALLGYLDLCNSLFWFVLISGSRVRNLDVSLASILSHCLFLSRTYRGKRHLSRSIANRGERLSSDPSGVCPDFTNSVDHKTNCGLCCFFFFLVFSPFLEALSSNCVWEMGFFCFLLKLALQCNSDTSKVGKPFEFSLLVVQ